MFCEKLLISRTIYSRKEGCLEVFFYQQSGKHIGSCSLCKLLWLVCQDGWNSVHFKGWFSRTVRSAIAAIFIWDQKWKSDLIKMINYLAWDCICFLSLWNLKPTGRSPDLPPVFPGPVEMHLFCVKLCHPEIVCNKSFNQLICRLFVCLDNKKENYPPSLVTASSLALSSAVLSLLNNPTASFSSLAKIIFPNL